MRYRGANGGAPGGTSSGDRGSRVATRSDARVLPARRCQPPTRTECGGCHPQLHYAIEPEWLTCSAANRVQTAIAACPKLGWCGCSEALRAEIACFDFIAQHERQDWATRKRSPGANARRTWHGEAGTQSCQWGAGDRTTLERPMAAEAAEMPQGCKGELAHPRAWRATSKPR